LFFPGNSHPDVGIALEKFHGKRWFMENKGRWLTALAIVATIGAAPACASSRYYYPGDRPGYGGYGTYGRGTYGNGGGYMQEVERIAHQNGYHEGREAGETDARRGRSFSFDRHDDWRDADEGYKRQYGDREFYRHEFREGFSAGYTEAYNANARGYRW
jgi:hypothetical protein